ncbi:MAG: molybdopterin synthase sulfur carrier subunit [Symbiopectobacterium sp.]
MFFAQVRELTQTDSLSLPTGFSSVEDLRQALATRGERWALALESSKLLIAVNQTLVEPSHLLRDGDEVAFFPTVTGG